MYLCLEASDLYIIFGVDICQDGVFSLMIDTVSATFLTEVHDTRTSDLLAESLLVDSLPW